MTAPAHDPQAAIESSAGDEPPLACRIDLGGCGTQLIEASAGTGKTWTLALLYARLVVECGLLPESILALTFTRAATAELAERVQRSLRGLVRVLDDGIDAALQRRAVDRAGAERRYSGEALALAQRLGAGALAPTTLAMRARAGLAGLDRAAIHTIHGFAERMLAEAPLSARLPPVDELVLDASAWREQIAADFWRKEVAAACTVRAIAGSALQADVGEIALGDKALATPGSLAQWLDPALRSAADPCLISIPPPGAPNIERAVQGWTAAWRDATEAARSACEQLDAAAVRDSIAGLRFVNRRSYSAARVPQWIDQTRQWLAAASQCPQKPAEAVDRLLPDAIGQNDAGHAQQVRQAHPWFGLLEAACKGWPTYLAARDHLCAHLRWLAWRYAADELPRRLQARQKRSADQTMRALAELAESVDGDATAASWRQTMRRRFLACMVDEFQDTDAAQWAIFKGLFSPAEWGGDLLLVGDPKQAIYRFRGADLAVYLLARAQVPAERRHSLDQNFRSVAPLVEALNDLHQPSPDYGDPAIVYQRVRAVRGGTAAQEAASLPVPQGLRRLTFTYEGANRDDATDAAAAAAAQWIAQACRAGEAAANIAVLVREHGEARAMQRALRRLGLPSARRDKASVFDSHEAADLLVLLRALAAGDQEGRAALERQALLSPLLGASLADITAQGTAPTAGADDANGPQAAQPWARSFEQWRAAERWGGAAAALARALMAAGRFAPAWGADGHPLSSERELTNLRHLLELLPAGSLRQAIRSYSRARAAGAAEHEGQMLRLESDVNAITISTIHAAKGLEFRHVVLPFEWAGGSGGGREVVDPLLVRAEDGKRVLHIGKPDAATAEAVLHEQRGESERLCYVALTRARDSLLVVWPDPAASNKKWIERAAESPLGRMFARSSVDVPQVERVEPPNDVPAAVPANVAVAGAPAVGTVAAVAPPPLRPVGPAYSLSSFSALRRLGDPAQPDVGAWQEAVRDHDEQSVSEASTAVMIEPHPQSLQGVLSWKLGSHGGTVMHDLLERVDFADRSAWDEPVATAARGLRLDGLQVPLLHAWLTAIVERPLPMLDGAPSLRQLARRRQQREWAFSLAHERLDAAALNAAIIKHGLALQPQIDPKAGMPAGFLDGVIDLMFEHQGRYYVLDYKTNGLGPTAEHYGDRRIAHEMQVHGYGLQAALYALAVHRALRLRRPNYDAERHFGGVIYYFVRAAALDGANQRPQAGWWYRPLGAAALAALERALPYSPPAPMTEDDA